MVQWFNGMRGEPLKRAPGEHIFQFYHNKHVTKCMHDPVEVCPFFPYKGPSAPPFF